MKKINHLMLTAVILGCSINTVNAAPLNIELVENGGAETGDTTGWISTGIDAVIPDFFGGGFGIYAFTGGTGMPTETLLQTINVSSNSTEIDNNNIESIFSIQLQSRSSDQARVDVSYLDGGGSILDSFTFIDTINVNASDWNLYSDTRTLLSGTQSIEILLTTTRNFGLSSDGFIDNVSFQLNNISAVPVSVPAAIWLFSSGLIGLFGLRKISSGIIEVVVRLMRFQ